jgi:hypothetical protein
MEKRLTAAEAREISEGNGVVDKALKEILYLVELKAQNGGRYIDVKQHGFTGHLGPAQKLIISKLTELGYFCKIKCYDQEYEYLEVRW